MKTTFRPAKDNQDDATFFAWGLNEATAGVLDLMMGKARESILSQACRITGHNLSLEHVTIAERDGRRVGILSDMPVEIMSDPFPTVRKCAGIRYLRVMYYALLGLPVFRAMEKHAEGEWYVQALAVLPEARNQGIGTKLLSIAEEKAAAHGATRLTLDVANDNPGGIRLYSRLGFERESASPPARFLNNLSLHRMTKPV